MLDDLTKKVSFWDKLKRPYRLTIMQEETFEEKGSYKLSLWNIYLIICLGLLICSLMIICLIAFTPLRQFVPGYGDVTQNTAYMSLIREVQNLDQELQAQRIYTENFRKLLVGEVTELKDEPFPNQRIDSLAQTPRVKEDEELRQSVEVDGLLERYSQTTKDSPTSGQTLANIYFTPPVTGIVTAHFNTENSHLGIDIVATENSPVKAILDGNIISADWTFETGNTVAIQHANSLISFYKHNSTLLKGVGDFVKAGEAVAIVGNTGSKTSGPHLHLEIWHDGQPINPANYIQFE